MRSSENIFRSIAVAFVLSTTVFLATAEISAQPFRVMTFNIRYDEPRDGVNAWPNRKQKVADVIKKYEADIVGVQEALEHQLKDLETLLPEMDWCGVGRTDGTNTGEYSAIFYNRQRFELIKTETFWLSETPDKAGSKGWDAALPRIVTWAKFKDRKTGKEFFHFNTHFDHMGENARVNSSRLLLEKVSSIAKKKRAVVTGDFNANYSTDVYKTIIEPAKNRKPILFDARRSSETEYVGVSSTFSAFKELVPENWIDHIFVNKDVRVLRFFAADDRPGGLWPSDHLPVVAEITFEKKKR
ncbi:MAG: endonuclease/exonuclease/phosphatase family protein [Acidobacteria bacterium]|nr:endonuclease/exonuclease/phosphatase family protein [Acidobacteriota bacterium]